MDRLSEDVLQSSCHILRGVQITLPSRKNLEIEIQDADRAQARGYYLPDEDECLRETYLRYLSGRSVLWQMIDELSPFLKSKDLRIFGLAFCAASMLMRSSSYLIGLARERPVVLAKLDEAEPRYQIPRKTLTQDLPLPEFDHGTDGATVRPVIFTSILGRKSMKLSKTRTCKTLPLWLA